MIQTYNLNLVPLGNIVNVRCSQYDKTSRKINMNIYNGNVLYSIPEGSVVTVRGTKPKDNTGFEYECEFSGSLVSFDIQDQMTIYAGKIPAEIRIVNDGAILGSANFLFLVEPAPLTDETVISETQLPLLEQALEAASEAGNYRNLAEQYAEDSEAYAIGTRGGVDVDSEDVAYENNSKYYSILANDSASEASIFATNAQASASNAEESATNASESEANALTYSQNASQSATEASESATSASESAENAEGSEQMAEQYATDAQASAANARTFANEAETYASNASSSASQASQSASNAQTYAQNAQSSASNASQSATSAQTFASNASTSATNSANSATASANSASQASTYANNASASATQASESATSSATSANESAQSATNAETSATNAEASATEAQEAVDTIDEAIKNKADKDGVYPKLIAGGIVETETKDEIFTYKVSEHTGIANLNCIKGNTLVFNQLVHNGNFADASNWIAENNSSTLSVSNNVATVTYNSGTYLPYNPALGVGTNNKFGAIQGHKYYVSVDINPTKAGNLYVASQAIGLFRTQELIANQWNSVRMFGTATNNNYLLSYIGIAGASMVIGDSISFRNYQAFDLTQMFGAGNEPVTVEEFTALFPLPYYEYESGKLLNFNGTGIKVTDADGNESTLSLPISTYFPTGMKSAGSVYDELTPSKASTRVGTRAYQSGDESDSTLTTDGTNTNYPLATPTEVDVDLDLSYKTYEGGTEQLLPVNTDVPTTSPLSVNVEFDFDENINARITKLMNSIAPVETSPSQNNYSVGQYLIYDYQLYKVTSAITTGQTLTVGTNITATTVMSELLSLTA